MGTVQTMIECPRCKSPECIEDYAYKSDETWVWCPDCGYTFSNYAVRGNGYYVMDDCSVRASVDIKDWHLVARDNQLHRPYGCIHVSHHIGYNYGARIDTLENFNELINDIETDRKQGLMSNVSRITFARWDGEKHIRKVLFENIVSPQILIPQKIAS